MRIKYKVSCPDEFPGIVEQDSIHFFSASGGPFECAQFLAETYMRDNIYEWEDDTQPDDLFHIKVERDNGVFVVEFFSNSPFSNSHYPDHTINVELLSFE